MKKIIRFWYRHPSLKLSTLNEKVQMTSTCTFDEKRRKLSSEGLNWEFQKKVEILDSEVKAVSDTPPPTTPFSLLIHFPALTHFNPGFKQTIPASEAFYVGYDTKKIDPSKKTFFWGLDLSDLFLFVENAA